MVRLGIDEGRENFVGPALEAQKAEAFARRAPRYRRLEVVRPEQADVAGEVFGG